MITVFLISTLTVPLLGALSGGMAVGSTHGKRFLYGLALLNLAAAVGLVTLVALGRGSFVGGPWDLALTTDRLGALFVVLAAGIQATVLPYALRCLDGRSLRAFAIASQALVAATDLTGTAATMTTLVLGWVLASAAVYGLVANAGAGRRAARKLGASFLIGDGALVVSLVLVRWCTGASSLQRLSDVETRLSMVRVVLGPLVLGVGDLVAVLIVIAAIVRSALWPGPRWLPSTLAAPTPVSALLHAGVVNAGGFLLIRLSPLLGSVPAAPALALAAGLGTAVLGGVATAVRSDVKGALVYSTMSQMGFMIAECAVGAFAAAVFHLVAHGMYKASLFLGSGDGIAEHVRIRQSSVPSSSQTPWTRPVITLGGALVVPALALIIHPVLFAHGGGVPTLTFATVTSASLMWGWSARENALKQTPLALLALAGIGAAYLLWASTLTGWLAPELPVVGTGFLSPLWLVGALVGVGCLAAVTFYAARRWPRVAACLHARAVWATWGISGPWNKALSKRNQRLEVELCKQPV